MRKDPVSFTVREWNYPIPTDQKNKGPQHMKPRLCTTTIIGTLKTSKEEHRSNLLKEFAPRLHDDQINTTSLRSSASNLFSQDISPRLCRNIDVKFWANFGWSDRSVELALGINMFNFYSYMYQTMEEPLARIQRLLIECWVISVYRLYSSQILNR